MSDLNEKLARSKAGMKVLLKTTLAALAWRALNAQPLQQVHF